MIIDVSPEYTELCLQRKQDPGCPDVLVSLTGATAVNPLSFIETVLRKRKSAIISLPIRNKELTAAAMEVINRNKDAGCIITLIDRG